jgi:Arc/MetJ family transcription regulator
MNASIEINDELLEAARQVTGLKGEAEVVEVALRNLVQMSAQERIRELRGKIAWEGDLEESRRSRFLED